MCEPRYYDVCYEINPWMQRLLGVEAELAHTQWQSLRDLIRQSGAEVVLIDQVHGLPDMVFTANAGLVHRNRVLLSHFKHPERQGEHEFFRAWFERAGYTIVGELPEDFLIEETEQGPRRCYRGPRFEGTGDSLFVGDTLFGAWGFRTDREYYRRVIALGIGPVIECQLVDAYFYHLDTCFCPVGDQRAIWWPQAFSEESRRRMRQAAELHAVSEQEARRFACNAVVLGTTVILPAGCPETGRLLEDLDMTVFPCEMSEFIKAGGACKCLTLML